MTPQTPSVIEVLPGVRADLETLVRIPSVSADPAASAEVRRSAELTAELFRGAGAADVEILQVADGQPAVVAHYPAPPGQPTVLLYAHHDVQPAGDVQAWSSAPFDPTERDGRLFGRGAADDKAGVALHLAALRAWEGRPPVGVTVFIEGEEEVGSPTLEGFLAQYHDRLGADVIVLADSVNFAVGLPALTTSLRGLVDCVVTVRTLEHGVHSGVYGGPAPDALTTLCRLLASLHDDQGNVAVAGLRHAPTPSVDHSEDGFRAEAGVLPEVELIGSGSITERLWAKPSVSVLAIDAPPVADASNTLHPTARAKVSMRIAPGDDTTRAAEALTAHLRAHAPWGAQVEVLPGNHGAPYAADAAGPAYDAARAAFRETWDAEPVDIGIGGSIPFIAAFANTFPDAAILVTGVEDPDTRAHGVDESLHLGEWERACVAETLLLAKLVRPSSP